jgi:hypothetical protein
MGKMTGAASLNGVAMLFQAPSGFRASKLLSRKDQDHILFFVAERHSVREGILVGGPSQVHAQGLIGPHSSRVEQLVLKRAAHLRQLGLSPAAWHFSDETDDSGHGYFLGTFHSGL